MNGGSLQIGQESRMYARNKQGVQILQGQAVYLYGAAGTNIEMKLADADIYNEACCVIAVATEDIADNGLGRFTSMGFVRTLDTGDYTEGNTLWLSATPGILTNVEPLYPTNKVKVGVVSRANNINGEIYVSIAHDKRKFGDVTGGNYSGFEDDGTLVAYGDATTYNDLIMPAGNLRHGNTPPVFAVFLGGIYAPRFDAGVADEVHGSVEFQHNYKEGTDIEVHVHWSPTTTNTGNIVFGFEYTVANMTTGTFGAPTTITNTPFASLGIINRHTYTTIGVISGTGRKIGDVIVFRFYRQKGGTDTFTGNAFVHSIGIHYECDTTGSRSVTGK